MAKPATTWLISMFDYKKVDESKIEFVQIAPVSELPNGERLFVEVEGKPIVIFNIAGQLYSIRDVCSHDDGPVGEGEIAGFNITCPRHGAEFDLRNGAAISMPAVIDIPAYPVQVREAMIFVGLPREP